VQKNETFIFKMYIFQFQKFVDEEVLICILSHLSPGACPIPALSAPIILTRHELVIRFPLNKICIKFKRRGP